MHILLITNDDFFTDVVRDLFRKKKAKVDQAITSQEALAFMGKKLPDVLVVDLDLAGLDESEDSGRLNVMLEKSAIPTLMVAAELEGIEESDWEELGIGADEIMFKQSRPENLKKKIERLARRQKQNADSWSERRLQPRIPIDVDVIVRLPDGFTFNSAVNISAGGLYLELDRPLDKGTKLGLRFPVPGGKGVVTVEGQVAWNTESAIGKRWGTGVRFVDIKEKDLNKIFSYAQSLRKVLKR